jgi:hypothetical protein
MLPAVHDQDFTLGCFEESVCSLSTQSREKLFLIGKRKNWSKYTSSSDFLFAELGGKKWRKTTVDFYRGQSDSLIMLLSDDELQGWEKTIKVACSILQEGLLEIKTFAQFRRIVLVRSAKDVVK